MITGQAIKSTVMDLVPSARATGLNRQKSLSGKDTGSFEAVLSNKAGHPSSLTSEKEVSDTKKTTNLSAPKETVTDNKPTQSNTNNNVKDKSVTTEEVKTEEVETTDSNDKRLETVAKAVNEVKEIVLKALQISEEELESLMGVLGLTMVDLLNSDALKQLTLESSGTNDFMMLLTDEGLNQQLTNLLDQVQGVLDQNGISQQELMDIVSDEGEYVKLMDKLLTGSKEVILNESLQSTAPMNEDKKADLNVVTNKEVNNTASNDETESLIEFTIERSSQENQASSQSNSGTDSKQNQEQGLTKSELTNQFLDQMVNSTQTTNTEFSRQVQQVTELREIANQILDQIKLVIKPSQTSMEFTLNPEHLGKVALNITSKEGLITATFTTQTHIAKEALESQLQIFKENLNNQGLKVDAIEVNVSSFSFEGSNQMDQSNHNQQEASKSKQATFRVDENDADFLESALAELVSDDLAAYGNNINYTA